MKKRESVTDKISLLLNKMHISSPTECAKSNKDPETDVIAFSIAEETFIMPKGVPRTKCKTCGVECGDRASLKVHLCSHLCALVYILPKLKAK